MEFNIINPYSSTGLLHYKGLDAIIKCFCGSSSSSSSSSDVDPAIIGFGNEETERFVACLIKYLGENILDESDKEWKETRHYVFVI